MPNASIAYDVKSAPKPTPRVTTTKPMPKPTPWTAKPLEATASCTAPRLESLDEGAWTALRRRGLEALKIGEPVPILYVHVFKAGGTSICDVAKAVGRRVPEKGFDDGRHRVWGRDPNCNMPKGFFRDRATQQATVLRLKGLQFVANELDGLAANGQMLLSPACAVWAISMRDPSKRFLSHFHALQRAYVSIYGAHHREIANRMNSAKGLEQDLHIWRVASERDRVFTPADLNVLDAIRVPSTEPGAPSKILPIHRVSAEEFVHFMRHEPKAAARAKSAPALRGWVTGDFFVRHLAGGFVDATDAPPEKLLARARERLKALFSVIIITDDLVSREDDPWRALRAPLGWDAHAAVLNKTRVHANAAGGASAAKPSNRVLADLRFINTMDHELFDFARELVANRTRTGGDGAGPS